MVLYNHFNELKEDIGDDDYNIFTETQQRRDNGDYHITVINVAEYNKISNDMGMDVFTNSQEYLSMRLMI
jgi:hypothetical protein